MRNLVTFGSPHQGVYGVPDCTQATGELALVGFGGVGEGLLGHTVHPFVTFGSPHQGVYGVPDCTLATRTALVRVGVV